MRQPSGACAPLRQQVTIEDNDQLNKDYGLVGPSVYNDLQELKNTGGKLLWSGARERLGQVFLVERENKKKSMHLLTHYAELVGDGSICSIEYILHQTLTLKS